MNDFLLRPLTFADIDEAMRLKAAASWNQTPADWEALLEIEPGGCFCIEADGRLAATATYVRFGDRLAWIGMVLTAPEARRRGFARHLVRHCLQRLETLGVHWAKLDATDMGRPLYADLGFMDETVVERWLRPAAPEQAVSSLSPGSHLESGASPDEFAALDLQAFGADRLRVLRRLARVESAAHSTEGYAMSRPGANARYFGPAVCRTPGAARTLLASFLSRHAGEGVFWDLLPANETALELAKEFGFSPVRRLVRMARPCIPSPAPLVPRSEYTLAIAGFEFG